MQVLLITIGVVVAAMGAIVLWLAFGLWTAALVLLALLVLAYFGIRAGLIWLDKQKVILLHPDAIGNYPMAVTPFGVFQPQAGNIVQPVSQTYSPHITLSAHRAGSVGALPFDQAANQSIGLLDQAKAVVPGFSELLERGIVGPGAGLLLGYDISGVARPLPGRWLDLYSAAIGGVSGSGKTTTVRFLAAQSALMGARFVLIDPHANFGDEGLAATLEPLARSFACKPATDDGEILAALWLADQELKRREAKGQPGKPFIVAVDEFTSLMRNDELAAPLQKLLLDIAQKGRKMGIFAMCLGQIWKGSTSGGTELRDSFASAYVHRMKRGQARLLIPTDEAGQVERLATGQAVLYKTSGELMTVAIPNTTADDVKRVAALLPEPKEDSHSWGGWSGAGAGAGAVVNPVTRGSAAVVGTVTSLGETSTANQPQTNQNSTGFATVDNRLQSANPIAQNLSADDARIVALFRQGLDIAAIVKEVRGVSGNQGTKYQTAAKEVTAVLRRALD